jgi:hypothetical protein
VYLASHPSTCAETCVVIKVRHCTQSVILFLWVPHHLVGVAFRASFIANNLCCVGTLASKYNRKSSKGFRPSNVGKLLTVVPIQLTSLINRAHLLVDTSYIWFCQFSSASSESDEHTLSLRQLKFPSVVGLMKSYCLAVSLYMFSSLYVWSSSLMGSVYRGPSFGSKGAMTQRPSLSNFICLFFKSTTVELSKAQSIPNSAR